MARTDFPSVRVLLFLYSPFGCRGSMGTGLPGVRELAVRLQSDAQDDVAASAGSLRTWDGGPMKVGR